MEDLLETNFVNSKRHSQGLATNFARIKKEISVH